MRVHLEELVAVAARILATLQSLAARGPAPRTTARRAWSRAAAHRSRSARAQELRRRGERRATRRGRGARPSDTQSPRVLVTEPPEAVAGGDWGLAVTAAGRDWR